MPFHFKMQKVLDYREQLEEEAKVDLALKQRLLEDARALFERLKTELRQSEDRLFQAALAPQGERWLMEQYIKGKLSPSSEKRAEEFQKRHIAYGSRNR